jgi:hypothetical protein
MGEDAAMAPRAALAVASLALTFASIASAHVKVVPTRIEPGQATLLTFSAPNERSDSSIAALEVRFPSGLVLAEVEQKPGWRDSVAGTVARWSGGRIPPRHFATFAVIATAVAGSGDLRLSAREIFANGGTAAYEPLLRVSEASSGRIPGRDSGARTLGKAALFVALAAGAVAFVGFFVALSVWLRSTGGRPREP